MRHHYAKASAEMDQSNYYRLLKEADLRQKIKTSYPDFDDQIQNFFKAGTVALFLQAEPKNITGTSLSKIAVSNSIIERKIMLKRLAEAFLNPVENVAAINEIEKNISEYAGYLGINQNLAISAAGAAKIFAASLEVNARSGMKTNTAPSP